MRSAVFSKIPFTSTHRHEFSAGRLRTVGGVRITFNGRTINFMATHFDPYETSHRLTQARELVAYMRNFSENRIVAGDFNEQYYDSPITTMTSAYYDAWAEGKKAGVGAPLAKGPKGTGQFGSYHPGMCQFVLADGSARALPVSINLVVLGRLANRSDGGVVSGQF